MTCQIVRDRNTGRSKGIAYAEFEEEESVSKALSLSGQKLKDAPIVIMPTMAERNRCCIQTFTCVRRGRREAKKGATAHIRGKEQGKQGERRAQRRTPTLGGWGGGVEKPHPLRGEPELIGFGWLEVSRVTWFVFLSFCFLFLCGLWTGCLLGDGRPLPLDFCVTCQSRGRLLAQIRRRGGGGGGCRSAAGLRSRACRLPAFAQLSSVPSLSLFAPGFRCCCLFHPTQALHVTDTQAVAHAASPTGVLCSFGPLLSSVSPSHDASLTTAPPTPPHNATSCTITTTTTTKPHHCARIFVVLACSLSLASLRPLLCFPCRAAAQKAKQEQQDRTKVLVENLPEKISTEEELKKLFAPFGKVHPLLSF